MLISGAGQLLGHPLSAQTLLQAKGETAKILCSVTPKKGRAGFLPTHLPGKCEYLRSQEGVPGKTRPSSHRVQFPAVPQVSSLISRWEALIVQTGQSLSHEDGPVVPRRARPTHRGSSLLGCILASRGAHPCVTLVLPGASWTCGACCMGTSWLPGKWASAQATGVTVMVQSSATLGGSFSPLQGGAALASGLQWGQQQQTSCSWSPKVTTSSLPFSPPESRLLAGLAVTNSTRDTLTLSQCLVYVHPHCPVTR